MDDYITIDWLFILNMLQMAASLRDWYFKLEPFTGARQAEGYFINEQKYTTKPAWFFDRMINAAPDEDLLAPEEFDKCVIDLSPSDSMGIDIDAKRHTFMRIVEFKMDNTPINIANSMNNTEFATVMPAPGSPQLTLNEFNTQPWQVQNLPPGFYPDHQAILEAMRGIDGTVLFEFTPRQTLRYTGSSILLLPVKGTIQYIVDHPAITCASVLGDVPANVSGLTQTNAAGVNATFVTSVNSTNLSVSFSKMWDYQDSLAAKLGFSAFDPDGLVRFYFDYPQIRNIPNTSDSANVVHMQNQEGAVFVAIYPGAEAPTCGNVYGAMSNVSVLCSEIFAPVEFDNVLLKSNVQGQPAFSSFELADVSSWLPVKPTGRLKTLSFALVDDLRRPYRTTSGPPYIRIELKSE